ncbi:glycosyltransferase, partial [Candidatus Saccharibacteria bacterium]|nr:glycosyltransferase [Candidatus Saccharibacteria bacterium]
PLEKSNLTILVPAYNEAQTIGDTLRSLLLQRVPAEDIIVIDDYSTDNTGLIARSYGVKVLRPPSNTGSKAGAQNFALQFVTTKYTMAIDADTTIAADAVEKLLPVIKKPNVAAACGFVLPRFVRSIWEKGRYVEYLFAFTFFKPIQDYYRKPLISSGCFSIYKTEILKQNGGWSTRTLAEDMDLTWSFYLKGYSVRFVPEACSYAVEPHNFTFMRKQLKRWSHGFIQSVMLHWRGLIHIPYLRSIIGVALSDAVIASLVYLIVLPVLAIVLKNPLFLLGYIIDIPAVIIPTLFTAYKRKETWLLIKSIPSFFILRTVNGIFMLEAIWNELIRKKRFSVYEKGH